MKKIFILFLYLFVVLTFNINAQDFFKIRVGNDGYRKVKPKNIVNDDENNFYPSETSSSRYIAYELDLPYHSFGLSDIGIMRIGANSNTTIYNILFSFDQNQVFHSRITDIEVYRDKIYALISINYKDVLLITLDKLSGNMIKKDFFKVNIANQYDGLIVNDLFISTCCDPLNPQGSQVQIGILGTYNYGTSAASAFSNLALFYKFENDNSFTEVKFVNPYRWGSIYMGEKILNLSTEGASIISNDAYGTGGITFDYDFNSQTVSNAKHYNVNNTPFRFFSQMSYDGVNMLYGQLSYSSGIEYTPGQSSDIFLIGPNSSGLLTFNNPNFIAFKGDDHTNGYDPAYLNVKSLFGGYYFSSSHLGSPYYGVVKIDFSHSYFPSLSGRGYPLSTKGKDTYNPSTGTYSGIDPINHSLTNNISMNTTINPAGVFEREPKNYWTDFNIFYYANNFGSSSCYEDFAFTQTFDKTLFVNDEYTIVETVRTQLLEDVNITSQYLPVTPHVMVCDETFTLPGRDTDNFDKKDTTRSTSFQLELSNNTMLNSTIKVYPNPINGYNRVTFSSSVELSSVQIYDMMKRVIFEKTNINSKHTQIQIGSLVSGIYIAVVKDKTNKISIIKLIK